MNLNKRTCFACHELLDSRGEMYSSVPKERPGVAGCHSSAAAPRGQRVPLK